MARCSRIRLQFSLRSLLVFALVVALVTAYFRPIVILPLLTGPLVSAAVCLFVRRSTRSSSASDSMRLASPLGWIALAGSLFLLLATFYLRSRWVGVFGDRMWPHPFPYPDRFLLGIHDWLDRMNPPPPGTLKLHGEYYSVLFGLNATVIVAFLVFGAVAGYIFRETTLSAVARRLTRRGRNDPWQT